MLFDPARLPEKKWLKLLETTPYLTSWGEALDTDALARSDHPPTEACLAEIEHVLDRCLDEALSAPKCAAFVRLFLPRPSSPKYPPSSAELRECKASWPPTGARLYDATLGLERAESNRNKTMAKGRTKTSAKQFSKRILTAERAMRTHAAEAKRALDDCIDEAVGDPKCAAFLKLIILKRPIIIPPPSRWLRTCETSWPPSGKLLYDLAVQCEDALDDAWDHAWEVKKNKLAEAEKLLSRALVSGKVVFNGELDGLPGDIDVKLFEGPPEINIYADIITAPSPRLGINAGRKLKWVAVRVELASLVAWLRAAATGDRTETAAITDLAEHLKNDRHLLRDVAFAWVQKQGYKVSYRGFQYRIWPRAREQAGLSARAPSGPKPKSPR